MLEKEVLQESKKNIGGLKTIKRAGFPLDINFLCPYCQYIGKFNKIGSAKIFSKTMTFKCFACGEFRRVE